jgi:hypothetical protein
MFGIFSWMDVKHQTSNWSKEIKYIITAFVVLIIFFIIRYVSIQQFVAPYEAERFLNFDIKGLSLNFVKLIFRSFSRQSGDFYLIVLTFLISITAVISFCITRKKIMALGLIVLWLCSYIPYLSLGIDTFGSESERYLYLPSIFLCIIIGIGVVNAAKVYKYVISLLFFFIHIIFMYQNRVAYRTASAVTASTVKELKSLSDKETIYVLQLPQENNGSLIFRLGFEGAVKLFAHPSAKVVVVSKYDGNYSFFNGVSEQPWIDGLPGNSGKDAVLDFSNSSLTVYR